MQLLRILSVFITENILMSLVDGYLTLSELTSSVKYNASQMPQNSNLERGLKTPLNITVSVQVSDIGFVFLEDDFHLELDLKVKLSWFDNRLRYIDRDLQNYVYTKDEKVIWTPRLVWITERKAKTNVPYTYFRIYPNALVAQVTLVSIQVIRSHSAGPPGGFFIRFLSLNYTEETLILQWNETSPVEITADLKFMRHVISSKSDFEVRSCHLSVGRISRRQGGDHSCLEIAVENGVQKSSNFIVYAPGIALVIISWSCFWMDPSNVLGRAVVLLACLLHLFIQKTSITKNLLLLRNGLILVCFLDVCVAFVVAAFLQAIWITYLYRITRISRATRHSSATTIQEEEGEGIVENSDGEANTLRNHFHFPRIRLNRFPSTPDASNAICRVGFPLCFVIFGCVFFAFVN